MRLICLAWWLAAASAFSVTSCHSDDYLYHCYDPSGVEGQVSPAPSATVDSFTSCHTHASLTYCLFNSTEYQFVPESTSEASITSFSSSEISSLTQTLSASSQSSSITKSSEASLTSQGQTTAVTGCHDHGATYYCINGNGVEGAISPSPTDSPLSFTGCHAHETETYCLDAEKNEVLFAAETGSAVESSASSTATLGVSCHYHAGVEHCVDSSGRTVENDTCERVDGDYNIPLRIGLIFAMLAIGLFTAVGPTFIGLLLKVSFESYVFVILKLFGTGVVLLAAFVHLLTHASLMFSNSCLSLVYESTTTAIVMGGVFISFLVDFILKKIVMSRAVVKENSDEDPKLSLDESVSLEKSVHDKISVILLEVGIVFHSVLIGITLVVAADPYFTTLFVVIFFHQGFEGIALGARIAELSTISLWTKVAMGVLFALTTPVGMAIGIGVLNKFNGNDPGTIIALGTLDALSAGILIWVGIVEMLCDQWLFGHMLNASTLKIIVGIASILGGMALMSFLGKWA